MKNRFLQFITKNIFGVFVFTILTGVLVNYIYDYLKAKDDVTRKPDIQQNSGVNIENKGNTGNTIIVGGNMNINSELKELVVKDFMKIRKTLYDIENILPLNSALQNCLNMESQKLKDLNKSRELQYSQFVDMYSYCKSDLDSKFLTVRGILIRDRDVVNSFVSKYPIHKLHFGEIDYLSYEIENDILALKLWLHMGCSKEVRVINIKSIDFKSKFSGNKVFMPCVMFLSLDEMGEAVKDINYPDSRGIVTEKYIESQDMDKTYTLVVDSTFPVIPEKFEIMENNKIVNWFMSKNAQRYDLIVKNIERIKNDLDISSEK